MAPDQAAVALVAQSRKRSTPNFLPLEANIGSKRIVKRKASSGLLALDEARTVEDTRKSNVVYVGHIPHGFYEDEMKGFFGQFGTIQQLRLSRNKKTGKSKHYAFIEFQSAEVAAIVTECMHNYLMFGSMLQVKLVPVEKLHPELWKGANQKFQVLNRRLLEIRSRKRERSLEEQQMNIKKFLKKDERRRERLEAMGIDYQYPNLGLVLPPAAKKIKFED